MRLSLFMNDDVRENVFKHVEVEQPLSIGATQSYSGVARRGNKGIGSNTSKPPMRLSPLPQRTPGSLIPLQVYTNMTSTCGYAEELMDELNQQGRK